MSLKPIAPNRHRPTRSARPAGMPPVVVVRQKKSGSGGLMMGVLLLAVLGGGYFVYNNQQQQKQAALVAKKNQMEADAQAKAENERLRAELENTRNASMSESEEDDPNVTALGNAGAPTSGSSSSSGVEGFGADATFSDEEDTSEGESTALGSTDIVKGTGEFAVEDTSAPAFDFTAEGDAAKNVLTKLGKAIDAAAEGNTFHDLHADLKRSFEVAQPGLFADETTLPAFPDKEHKLQRLAQGVYVCLSLAAELDARDTVPAEKHAKFVNWLMKEKAKAARTFAYGLEHNNISDVSTATEMLDELRTAYIKTPTSALKKIPTILKKGAE